MPYNYVLIVVLFFLACRPEVGYKVYSGEIQGTTFLIKYESINGEEYDDGIDSIFIAIDNNFSIYLPDSKISEFNASEIGIEVGLEFIGLWEKCWELNIETNGYFDPTLAGVFEAYGQMTNDVLDSNIILSALEHSGMPLISNKDDFLLKKDPKVKINFNAIAQGYTVDLLASFLNKKGLKNYMVEVGGEVFAKGINEKGSTWTIGIDKPLEKGRKLISTIQLNEMSLATSGNYRSFIELNGRKLGHIINPKTGFPVFSNILSVSVLAKQCFRADALATGLMNMSSEEIKEFDAEVEDIQLILIELVEGDTTIYVSPELKEKNNIDYF